jgi:hypothetical protein
MDMAPSREDRLEFPGRYFPRGIERNELLDEGRIFDLDQADDGGAGNGHEGPGSTVLPEVFLDGEADFSACEREIECIIESQILQTGNDLVR